MSVRVMISPALRRFVDCEDEVEVRAGTIASLLTELDRHCSGIAKISSASGKSVNIYVNEKDVRTLMNGQTEVQDGDEVFIVPAISEG